MYQEEEEKDEEGEEKTKQEAPRPNVLWLDLPCPYSR